MGFSTASLAEQVASIKPLNPLKNLKVSLKIEKLTLVIQARKAILSTKAMARL